MLFKRGWNLLDLDSASTVPLEGYDTCRGVLAKFDTSLNFLASKTVAKTMVLVAHDVSVLFSASS